MEPATVVTAASPSLFPPLPLPVTPAGLQSIFLILTIVAALAVLAAAVRIGMRRGSAVPVLMVFGGLAAILMETVVTYLGHAVHPEAGQIVMFKAVDRSIPWHIGLGYMAGFGVFYLFLYGPYVDGKLTAASIWKTTVVSAVCYFVGEAYPVSNGLWIYYEPQVLWVWKGTAPVIWNVLNATCMLTSATAMLLAASRLKGPALLLLVPLGAVGATMGHMGAGLFFYNAVNAALPAAAMEAAGLLSVLMAGVTIWLCTLVLTRKIA